MTAAQVPSYREAWESYERHLRDLAQEIECDAPHAGDGETLDGRAWCDAHDVPERMFVHAVETEPNRLDWGVTPLRPWVMD